MSTIQSMQNLGQKGRGLGHVTYFSILGSLNISNVDDENLRAGLPSLSRDRAHSGRGPGKERGRLGGALPRN